jgi:hypothetical protein
MDSIKEGVELTGLAVIALKPHDEQLETFYRIYDEPDFCPSKLGLYSGYEECKPKDGGCMVTCSQCWWESFIEVYTKRNGKFIPNSKQ